MQMAQFKKESDIKFQKSTIFKGFFRNSEKMGRNYKCHYIYTFISGIQEKTKMALH